MSKVTDCARELGQAIVDSEEYKTMQMTEKTAMSDPAVAAAMSRYLEAKDNMHAAMSTGDADRLRIQPGDGRCAAGTQCDACRRCHDDCAPEFFRIDESGQPCA